MFQMCDSERKYCPTRQNLDRKSLIDGDMSKRDGACTPHSPIYANVKGYKSCWIFFFFTFYNLSKPIMGCFFSPPPHTKHNEVDYFLICRHSSSKLFALSRLQAVNRAP